MFVKERPTKVIATLITGNSGTPHSWQRPIRPRVVGEPTTEATLAMSRGIFRERICQEERYYKHKTIDDADRIRLIELITGKSLRIKALLLLTLY